MKSNSIVNLLALAMLLVYGLAMADPPARVGRLSLIEGTVSFSVGGEGGNDNWQATQLNWPITQGNRLYADSRARAEVNIGASALRLSEQTAIAFTRLDDERIEANLTQGTLNITLKNWDRSDDFVVTTPTLRVTFNQNGRYLVSVADGGDTASVTVRQGEAQVVNGNSRFNVIAPQQATIGGQNGEQVNIARASAEDDFERWAADRDRRQDAAYSARYVAPDTPGLYELDRYGNWRDVGDYGPVWVPSSVAVGWAPYRYGHWAWVAPWGWTWLDEAPWGFAPFHYGRWVYVNNYWAWAPGRVYARPVYAPALVGFISSPGFSVSVNIGPPCGWVPLAPWETYRPYYQTSPYYVTRINVPHVHNDGEHRHYDDYHNRHSPGGISIVAPDVMLGSLPVARAILPVEPHLLREITRIAPPLPPLPRIGALVPRPVFAQPVERRRDEPRHEEHRRDSSEREIRQGAEQKFQTSVPRVQPVIERESPDNRRDRAEGEQRRPPRVVVEPVPVPRGAVGSPAPLPMPGNVIRDMRRDRPLPPSPPLPMPSSVSRDIGTAPVMVRERTEGGQPQYESGRGEGKAQTGVVRPQ